MHSYPEPTPVVVLLDNDPATRSGSDGGAAACPSALEPTPFQYLQQTQMPPNAIETQGGCNCSGGACREGNCACAIAHQAGLNALVRFVCASGLASAVKPCMPQPNRTRPQLLSAAPDNRQTSFYHSSSQCEQTRRLPLLQILS